MDRSQKLSSRASQLARHESLGQPERERDQRTARKHELDEEIRAQASGGAAYLASVHGPLPDLRFCPTGGITPANAPDYLALPNVGCVGGTWLTPADAVAQGDWQRITALAAAVRDLAVS